MNESEERYLDLIDQWVDETTTWRKKMFPPNQAESQEFRKLVKDVDEIISFIAEKRLTNEYALNLFACALAASLYNYRREVLMSDK